MKKYESPAVEDNEPMPDITAVGIVDVIEDKLITVDVFARTDDPLKQAFAVCEMLTSGGHVKQSRARWLEMFEAWKLTRRGN